jgi:hypothetical protein
MAKKSNYDEQYKSYFESLMSQPNPNATPLPTLPTNEPIQPIVNTHIPTSDNEVSRSIPKPHVVQKHTNAMMYEDIVIETLPMSTFYSVGTRIQFRDLTVAEVEHFSTLDESNEQDFIEKLNDILESCILFTHADGTIGSYLDIKEGDRPWLIYMIREKTFPSGKVLSVRVPYIDDEGNKVEVDIEFKRENFEIYKNEDIMEFFDPSKRCLVLDTVFREEPYYIAPPTVGLKKCFDQYLKIRIDELKHLPEAEMKEKINSKFIAMCPYFKPNITYMSYEDIRKMQSWFETSITTEEYTFLYDLFKHHLKLGIAGLKKNMDTTSVRYNKVYPNRRSTLFLLPNAFRLYLRHKATSK